MSMNCMMTRLCDGRPQKDHVVVTIFEDVWFEIFSRLPVKSLLTCQLVCKNWRDIINNLKNNIMNNPQLVPLCGLLLKFYNIRKSRQSISYICLKTGKICEKKGWFDEIFMVKSGYVKGLLANISFNFIPVARYCFITMHKGLLLFSGSYPTSACRVYNPVTKKMLDVPYYSPILVVEVVTNMIVRFPTALVTKCDFIIIGFFRSSKLIEVYHSTTMSWKRFNLVLDDEIVNHHCLWDKRNYVALVDGLDSIYLYVLTNMACGFAITFRGDESNPHSITNQCTFPLPQLHGVLWLYKYTSLWDCAGTLYLSYYSANELLIWKHHLDDYGSTTQADAWSWVPLLQSSNSPDLFKLNLVAGNVVRPLAFHPDVPVMYVLINHRSIFAYNLSNGALDKIAESNDCLDYEQAGDVRSRLTACFPFKPCLSSFDAELSTTVKRSNKAYNKIKRLLFSIVDLLLMTLALLLLLPLLLPYILFTLVDDFIDDFM